MPSDGEDFCASSGTRSQSDLFAWSNRRSIRRCVRSLTFMGAYYVGGDELSTKTTVCSKMELYSNTPSYAIADTLLDREVEGRSNNLFESAKLVLR